MMELSLVENIQRENLNPIEEARAFNTLAVKLGLTHEQISERVGKQRVSITNSLRLLGLPEEEREELLGRASAEAGRRLHAAAIALLEAVGAARLSLELTPEMVAVAAVTELGDSLPER